MDWLFEFGNLVWAWFGVEDNQNRIAAIAAAFGILAAILGAIGTLVWWLLTRKNGNDNSGGHENGQPPTDPSAGPVITMTLADYEQRLEERAQQVREELEKATEQEAKVLRGQLAELESRIANPETALAEARKRIKALEALLDREANQIGGDRIAEAKAAMEKGDNSLADDIFAEIEARAELEIQQAARAAFGRGEIAEQEVRWADAANHFARSAKLDPRFTTLRKASEHSQYAGRYEQAALFSAELVGLARKQEKQELLADALNEHALNSKKLGRYEESERLYRDALEIDRATVGAGHPDYATGLNNLSNVVLAQGRNSEAEALYREAMEIDRATIGTENPHYAIRLNNLACAVQAQGRYAEAEDLYRQAMEITRATLGEAHPDYATRLNNLGLVVRMQGRYAEAEELYRKALEIDRATIGEKHPDYATRLNNLADLLAKTDRPGEARLLFEQALAIREATLPSDHPSIATVKAHLAALDTPS